MDRKIAKWLDWWLANPLAYNKTQRQCGHVRSLETRRRHATRRRYRAHVLRRAGLSTQKIAAELAVTPQTIRADLRVQFAAAAMAQRRLARQAQRARPKPPPPPLTKHTAKICSLLVSPSTQDIQRVETPTDTKFSPHASIDPLAELKTHWAAQDRPKSPNSHNAPPTKPTPETKIGYAP